MRPLAIALAVTSSVALTDLASAADLPVKALPRPVVAAPYNWTGFYIGVNAGGSWGHQDNSLETTTGVIGFTNSDRIDGFIGGGQIGYNWQVNQWVFGLEADFQGSGQKGGGGFSITPVGFFAAALPATTIAYEDKLNWFGTVRGRIGWAFDRWMPYITGGWAYGHGEVSGTTVVGVVGTSFSASQDYSGWTIGGGVEWAFQNNWSAKIEYLYIDFGDGPTVAVSPALNIASGKLTDNIVRVGVNYKF
jgi:outer membrane immunogenic protein